MSVRSMNSSSGCVNIAVEVEDAKKNTTDEDSNKLEVDLLNRASDTESPLTMEEGTDNIHPDLLPWREDHEPFSVWMILCGYLSLYLSEFVVVDAARHLHLRLFTISLWISSILVIFCRMQRTRKQLPIDGERVIGRIVAMCRTEVHRGMDEARVVCFFVIEYIFDNVTYQKQYEDKTLGLLATETYLEVIVPKADPRSPVLAIVADAHNARRHHCLKHRYDQWMGYGVTFFLILPFLLLSIDCCVPTISSYFSHVEDEDLEQCNLITWFNGVLHWTALLGLYFCNGHLEQQWTRKVQVDSQAVALGKAMNLVELPARVSYQSLLLPPGCTNHSFIYRRVRDITYLTWIAWLFYVILANHGDDNWLWAVVSPCLGFYSLILGIGPLKDLMVHHCLVPLRAKFEEEGLSPKNLTVLKSGGYGQKVVSIIQYETEMTKSDGNTETVTVRARVPRGQENAVLILPSNPKSICFSAKPSTAQLHRDAWLASHRALRLWLILKSALRILYLLCLLSPFLILLPLFYVLSGNISLVLIATVLFLIPAVFESMAVVDQDLSSALGRTGETEIVEGVK